MYNISFTSIYRIPDLKGDKRQKVINIAKEKYEPYVVTAGNQQGPIRVSIPDENDFNFEQDLRRNGIKKYQKFSQNFDRLNDLDVYIKECLDSRNYEPHGEQMRGKGKKRR